MTSANPSRLLTVRQVAERLNRGISTVWSDVAAGRLPAPLRIGGSSRFLEHEIDALIEAAIAERDAARPSAPATSASTDAAA